jgi:hypothetical protein
MLIMTRSTVACMILLAGAFAGTAHAFRVIEEVENSVELALGEITLPSDATGRVRYRPCATCPAATHSVSEETIYRLNGRVLPLVEFLAEVEDIRRRPSIEARAVVFVYFDLNTRDVNRVTVRVSGG